MIVATWFGVVPALRRRDRISRQLKDGNMAVSMRRFLRRLFSWLALVGAVERLAAMKSVRISACLHLLPFEEGAIVQVRTDQPSAQSSSSLTPSSFTTSRLRCSSRNSMASLRSLGAVALLPLVWALQSHQPREDASGDGFVKLAVHASQAGTADAFEAPLTAKWAGFAYFINGNGTCNPLPARLTWRTNYSHDRE